MKTPKRKFKYGDIVRAYSHKGRVYLLGPYDDHAGTWRYKVEFDSFGQKWVNEKSMRKIAHRKNPVSGAHKRKRFYQLLETEKRKEKVARRELVKIYGADEAKWLDPYRRREGEPIESVRARIQLNKANRLALKAGMRSIMHEGNPSGKSHFPTSGYFVLTKEKKDSRWLYWSWGKTLKDASQRALAAHRGGKFYRITVDDRKNFLAMVKAGLVEVSSWAK